MPTDLVDFVESLGIDLKQAGVDVGYNDFNVDCPYCGYDKHLGIHRDTGQINCWVCGFEGIRPRPQLLDLVMLWMDAPRPGARAALKRARGFGQPKPAMPHADVAVWPADCMLFHQPETKAHRHDRDLAYSYWKSRGFTTDDISEYDVRFTARGQDDYAGRIIFPVTLGGKTVNWVGRDYTGRRKPKYKNARTDSTVIKMSSLLWGLDRFISARERHIRLCEGIFDAMTLGRIGVSVQKSKLSPEQLGLIRRLKPHAVTVIFDPATAVDRYVKARALKAAQDISAFIGRVKLVELVGGDVADLGAQEVLRVEAATAWRYF